MVMLFPVALTTTLPTPSHHVLPSALVLGPLLWSIWANLLSLLQVLGSVLGSMPVCTSLKTLPIAAFPHISVASGLSSQSEIPSIYPCYPLYRREMGPERAQFSLRDTQQSAFLDGL